MKGNKCCKESYEECFFGKLILFINFFFLVICGLRKIYLCDGIGQNLTFNKSTKFVFYSIQLLYTLNERELVVHHFL